MKITFSNLGAIKKTTLDLRPLTVIIGPNNSNKTYVAYSIYGLLQHLSNTTTVSFLNSLGFGDVATEELKPAVKLYELDKNGVYSLKIDDEFFQLFNEDCTELIRSFRNGLEVFFQDTSKKIFNQTNFEVEFTNEEIKASLNEVIVGKESAIASPFQFSLKKTFYVLRPKIRYLLREII